MKLLCWNKTEYVTAEAVIAALLRKQCIERMRLYGYKCQFCTYYHLTKKPPPPEAIVSIVSKKTGSTS